MAEEKFTIDWKTRMTLKPGATLSLDDVSYAGRLIDELKTLSGKAKALEAMRGVVRISFWTGTSPVAERTEEVNEEMANAIKGLFLDSIRQKADRVIKRLEQVGIIIAIDEGGEGK